jgi:hypothetical protein
MFLPLVIIRFTDIKGFFFLHLFFLVPEFPCRFQIQIVNKALTVRYLQEFLGNMTNVPHRRVWLSYSFHYQGNVDPLSYAFFLPGKRWIRCHPPPVVSSASRLTPVPV